MSIFEARFLYTDIMDMKLAVYIGKREAETDEVLHELWSELRAGGCDLEFLSEDICPDADMLMSVGGDGTFLSAAMLVAGKDIPVVGVNLGRLGFLSENRPAAVAAAILSGEYTIENRTMLKASLSVAPDGYDPCPCALNEFTVHRSGAAMLGVEVMLDGVQLPTYWADGLIVSTSSGSTAYSLSAGGPIALPESKVLIISPIAPHNLNVRPLIVPDSSTVEISFQGRNPQALLTVDNRSFTLEAGEKVTITKGNFPIKTISINNNFIAALNQKLLWGEDKRNMQ